MGARNTLLNLKRSSALNGRIMLIVGSRKREMERMSEQRFVIVAD